MGYLDDGLLLGTQFEELVELGGGVDVEDHLLLVLLDHLEGWNVWALFILGFILYIVLIYSIFIKRIFF